MSVDIEALVNAKVTAVNTLISDAKVQLPAFTAAVEDMASQRPLFVTPNMPSLPVREIIVSATAPESPDIQGAINDIVTSDPGAFSPSGRVSAIGEIPQTYLDWIPQLATLEQEEDKFLGEYSPTLVAALTAKLLNDIENGGTGLSAAVQDAIINDGYERDSQIYRDARDKVLSTWSASGMEIPDNVLTALIQDMITKEANLRTDRGRQITVDTFKMADANTKWAVEQGIVLESKLMEMFNQSADRVIKYVLSKLELSSTIFRNLVDAYKSEAEVALTDARITGEYQKNELDAWLGKLSGYKTIADVGLAKVDALVKRYQVDMQRYSTDASISEAQGRINLEQADRDTKNILWLFKAGLDTLQHNLDVAQQYAGIKERGITANGQILANYLAAITNSLNANIGLNASQSSQI